MSSKKLIEISGSVLALLGVIFILSQLVSYRNQLSFDELHIIQWSGMVLLAITYAIASLLLAMAWQSLLHKYELKAGWRWSTYIYGKTQIIKYVPGNIFHIASRQAEGQLAGFPAFPLAKSAAWEILCIASVALPFAPILLTNYGLSLALSGGLALLVLGIIGVFWLKVDPNFFKASTLYFGFLLCSSLLFYFLILIATDHSFGDWKLFFIFPSIYTISWLAGFITPGSPAGVGLRELALIFFLKNHLPEPEVLMLVLLSRCVTGLGDTLFFFGTRWLKTSDNRI